MDNTTESLNSPSLPNTPIAHSTVEEPDGSQSLFDRVYPREVPFFKLTLLDRLLHRPYHVVRLEGPFDLQQLADDHRDRTFRSETTIDRSGNAKIMRLLLRLEGEVFGYLDGDSLQFYAPTPEAAQAAAKGFRRYVKSQPVGTPRFYIISIAEYGPRTETVTIERPAPIRTEELALNYGEDFPTWEKQWHEQMRRKPSGLSVLYGPPGCGKTSYLRALMSRLNEEAVFYYVPVAEIAMLSSPRFVGFWVDQTRQHQKKSKIAILEDAEEMLLSRDTETRDKVSNLLNIGDGFLGDYLKLHVVATANMPINKLDAAIVRPGRLIGIREFRRLTRPEARRLAEAKGLALPNQNDFSLAELYCSAAGPGSSLNGDRQMGFAQ